MNPIKKVIIAFVIFLAIGSFISIPLVSWFSSMLPEGITLVAFSPTDTFIAVMTIIFAFAIIFTTPIALFEMIRFVKPALYQKERKDLMKILPISVALFVSGAIFGVYIMIFIGLNFFAKIATMYGINNLWSLSGLVEGIASISIAFGIAFQLPIMLVFLVKFGFVKRSDLTSFRVTVFLGLLIVSAIVTPPDAISMLFMALPLYALYEGTLVYLKFFNKEQKWTRSVGFGNV